MLLLLLVLAWMFIRHSFTRSSWRRGPSLCMIRCAFSLMYSAVKFWLDIIHIIYYMLVAGNTNAGAIHIRFSKGARICTDFMGRIKHTHIAQAYLYTQYTQYTNIMCTVRHIEYIFRPKSVLRAWWVANAHHAYRSTKRRKRKGIIPVAESNIKYTQKVGGLLFLIRFTANGMATSSTLALPKLTCFSWYIQPSEISMSTKFKNSGNYNPNASDTSTVYSVSEHIYQINETKKRKPVSIDFISKSAS